MTLVINVVAAWVTFSTIADGGGGIPVDAFFGTLRDTLSGKDKLYSGAASGAESATLLAEAGPTETAFSMARKRTKRNEAAASSRSPSPSPRKTKTLAGSAGSCYTLPNLSSLNPLPKFQVRARVYLCVWLIFDQHC